MTILKSGETFATVKEYGDPASSTVKCVKMVHCKTGTLGIGSSTRFTEAQAAASDMIQSQLSDDSKDDSSRATLKKVRGLSATAFKLKESNPTDSAVAMGLAIRETLEFVANMSHVDNFTARRLAELCIEGP